MRLAARQLSADSAAIEDIPSSMQLRGNHHEHPSANALQLQPLSRHGLHLRLPTSRLNQRLRLQPAMCLRCALRLLRAVHLRHRRQLRPILSRPAFTPRISPVNNYVLAYAGGIVGAVLMDITETFASRAGLTSGVSVALVGRWALGLLRGQWAHVDIAASPALPGEVRMGWAFHFLIGGGGVALLYAALLEAAHGTLPVHLLWGGVAFGASTSLLPWLLLLPAFGWGWFGRRGPKGSNALLASTLSHLPYGLGVGAVMALGAGF